jgi:twitching motility protein PilT
MNLANNSAGGQLSGWLKRALDTNASDLHLVCGYPPVLRIHGKLSPITEQEILSAEALTRELGQILTEVQTVQFSSELNLDFAVDIEVSNNLCRFRVNIFRANGTVGACLRVIPDCIPDFSWSSFPKELAVRLGAFSNGLVLFTGVTGSGKSTS